MTVTPIGYGRDPIMVLDTRAYARIKTLISAPQASWKEVMLGVVIEWEARDTCTRNETTGTYSIPMTRELTMRLLGLLLRDYTTLWAKPHLVSKVRDTEHAIDQVIRWYAKTFPNN